MSYETNRIGEFLQSFAKAAGLSDLALSDEGSLFLSVDGAALTLRYFPATDDLVIASIAAKCPEGESGRLALYEKALKMNAFSPETGEGVLGLLPDGSALVYSVWVRPGKLSYGDFEALLLGTADRVKKLRAAFAESEESDAAPADLSWMQGAGVLSV